jgi:hypothetical protein
MLWNGKGWWWLVIDFHTVHRHLVNQNITQQNESGKWVEFNK